MNDRRLRALLPTSVLLALAFLASAGEAPPKSEPAFLDKAAGAALFGSEACSAYFDRLQPMEMAAKTGSPVPGADLAAQRAECRRRYVAGVRTFSEVDRKVLKACVAQLKPILARDYPLFAATPWSFLKISDAIEGGLPHTQGGSIVLSESTLAKFIAAQKAPDPRPANAAILGLLVHEQMHVFQRANPGLLDPLYRDVWGFEKAGSIRAGPRLEARRVVDPDAPDACWVLPAKKEGTAAALWPLVVFSDGDGPKKMPRDFRMLSVALDKKGDAYEVRTDPDGKPISTDLLKTPEFRAILPLGDSLYHPDEALADLFGTMITFDSLIPKRGIPKPEMEKIERALGPLRTWLRERLKRAEPAPAKSPDAGR